MNCEIQNTEYIVLVCLMFGLIVWLVYDNIGLFDKAIAAEISSTVLKAENDGLKEEVELLQQSIDEEYIGIAGYEPISEKYSAADKENTARANNLKLINEIFWEGEVMFPNVIPGYDLRKKFSSESMLRMIDMAFAQGATREDYFVIQQNALTPEEHANIRCLYRVHQIFDITIAEYGTVTVFRKTK